MKDMVCPRCGNPLHVERVGNIIEIACVYCRFISDVANNVRDAQKEFFENVDVMDTLDNLREWAKKNKLMGE